MITVLCAGGTIDKTYGKGLQVRNLHIGPPAVRLIYKRMQLQGSVGFRIRSLMRKDSLDMDDKDRQKIVSACVEAKTRSIIITHGTDSILKTAEAIHNSGISHAHRIVLTGSLLPACVTGSDAEFNTGAALVGALSDDYAGIFIALNGFHEWNRCYKHEKTGVFTPK
jgi:L-asparaginase